MYTNNLLTTLGSRSLLQAPESSNLGNNINCTGAVCLVFNVLAVVIILFFATLIFAFALYKKWKRSRAIKNGSLPATFLISQWAVPPSERGSLAAFSFPVRRPKTREEINEESCPICLKEKLKPTSWLVFGACNHATCNSCFKRLVSDQKLHAACPICRTTLVQGEGNRGEKPSVEQPVVIATEPVTTTAVVADAPLPPSDNNV